MAGASDGSDEETEQWARDGAEALALTPEQRKTLLYILGSTVVPARICCEAGKADKALPMLSRLDALMTAIRWQREGVRRDSGR
jgi:hypothetical protein